MSVKTVINETHTLLNSIGVVNSKTEFYKDWFNRSESNMRVHEIDNLKKSAVVDDKGNIVDVILFESKTNKRK